MPEKRYDEKEVSALIQRAAAIQAASDSTDGVSSQPTLGQIQDAAAELGIAPVHFQRAADELRSSANSGGLWGGALSFRKSVDVQGRLSEDRWPAVVQRIRDRTGRVGTPQTFGTGYEWTSLEPDGLHIAVTPDNERSRISVHLNLTPWFGLYVVIPLFAMTIVTIGLSVALGPFGFAGGMLLASAVFFGGRGAFGRKGLKKRLEAEALLNDLAAEILACSRPSVTGLESRPSTPDVDASSVKSN